MAQSRTNRRTEIDQRDSAPETPETPAETPAETGATASTRGRKATCKAAMANGSQCELPKGHEGPHSVVTLDDAELADLELSDDEIAALLGTTKTPGIRPAEQLKVDAQVAENFAAWVAAGADTSKPNWKVKAVEIPKRAAAERLLRKAADFHKPPVGMRIKTGPIRDGKALVLWAAVKRMESAETPETPATSGE